METETEIKLPNQFQEYTLKEQTLVFEYLNQLNPLQKQVYNIAKEHLGSSFNILKSNGFLEWLKNQKGNF